MRELRAIAKALQQARSNGKAAALATVVNVRGSAYRRPGARTLITEEGQSTGTISGGCLERDVILRAQRAIERCEATLATYDSTDEHEVDFGAGLGCGGVIQILIEPLPRAGEPGHLPLVDELLQRCECGVLATVWQASNPQVARCGSRLLIGSDGELWNDIRNPQLAARIGADARQSLQARRSAAQRYELRVGYAEVFVEVLQPPTPLVVFGGGYDAVPLVQFARELGWHVTVVDRRPSAASHDRFPQADVVRFCRADEVSAQVPLTRDTVAVVMTHNYRNDLELLKLLLPSSIRYVGVLGSKMRSARLLQELREAGINLTLAQRRRLHAPIGLDIGAETCQEIALAIVAEIRATLSGRAGGHLKECRMHIHDRVQSQEVLPTQTVAIESASCA
jgi:xanthine dehydrogenase accessory factor